MRSEIALAARGWACGFTAVAALVGSALALPAAAHAKHLELTRAQQAARAVVLADPTYRVIDSSQPLRTRRCWRAPGQVVHCSLYRYASTPCALEGTLSPGELCTQVLARRIWLVEVRSARPPAARLMRVVDTTKHDRCRTRGDDRLCS